METKAHDEPLELIDGRRVRLRPLRRGDRGSLAGLFAALSPESRRRRFLAAKARLSERELDHLSDVERPAHQAMAAIDARDGAIVGVSRFIAVRNDPVVADVAIEVADDFQNLGIGTALTRHTLAQARAHEVAALSAVTLRSNVAAHTLLGRLGFRVSDRVPGDADVTFELAL